MPDMPLNWPDLATTLFDKLTGRGAEIRYDFVNLEVFVPRADARKVAQVAAGRNCANCAKVIRPAARSRCGA